MIILKYKWSLLYLLIGLELNKFNGIYTFVCIKSFKCSKIKKNKKIHFLKTFVL